MAGSIQDLVARLIGDASSLNRALSDAATATEGLAASWTRAGSDIASSASRISVAIGAAVGGITAYAARLGVSFNAGQENARLMFTTLLGDGELAKQKLSEILDLSKTTPFSFAGIRDGAVQFLNAKVSATELIPKLRAVGDAVSAIGGNDEALKGVALALSQMMTSGRLSAQDAMQLSSRGIAAWDILAEHFGKTVAEVRKMSEAGQIDGREAANAIIEGMKKRFEGASAELGRTFDGLWSSLKDNVGIKAGVIFEPLSNAVVRAMTAINNALDNGSLSTVVLRLQEAVSVIVDDFETLASENGADIIKSLADGFVWLAQSAGQFTRYLVEQGPALVETAAGWLGLLKPIMQFLADHPTIMAALIALRITGLLGVNQALISLGSALFTTIKSLAGFSTAATGATTATAGLSAGLSAIGPLAIAAVIAGIAYAANQLANELYGVDKAGRAAFEQMKELDKLSSERRLTERQRNRDEVSRETDPAERKKILQRQLADAQKNAAGLQSQEQGAKAAADSAGWGASNIASKVMTLGFARGGESTAANEELADVQKRAKEAAAEVKRLTEEVIRAERDEEAAKVRAARKAEAEAVAAAAKAEQQPEAARSKELDAAIEKHRNDAINAQHKGYDQIRDVLGMGGTAAQVQEFAGNMKGSNPQLAAQLAELYQQSDKSKESLDALALAFVNDVNAIADVEKRTDAINDKFEVFAEKLGDLKGVVPEEQIQKFKQTFNDLSLEFAAGKLDADGFKTALSNLDHRIHDASQAAHGQAGIKSDLDRRRDALAKHDFGGNEVKGLSADVQKTANNKFAAIEGQAKQLADKFNAGKISAGQFAAEMDKLKKATDAAADAAIKEENEKRKLALINHDFAGAGLDFGKAVQDKLADQQMQQFDQYVTDFINQFIPLTTVTQTITDGFTALNTGMQQFGEAMKKNEPSGGGSGASGEHADDQATAWYANFLASTAGMIATLKNDISMDWQALEIITDPQERQKYLDAINNLTNEINQLNRRAATFNGYRSNDPIFRDPGINRNAGGGNTNTVTINMPNIGALSQGEMETLYNNLANVISRQGYNSFGN